MKGRIARDFFAYLPARILPPALYLLAIPIFTRVIPQEEYGHYLLALTTLTLTGACCAAWLGSIVVRFLPIVEPGRLRSLCLPLLASSVLAAVFSWLVAALLQGQPLSDWRYLAPGILWIASYTPFEYFAAWLRARNQAVGYSLSMCWRALGSFVIPLPFLLWGIGGGETILWCGAAGMLLMVVALWRNISTAEHRTGGANQKIGHKQLLAYGLPSAGINLANTALGHVDRYVINVLLGVQAVAIYGASYDIAEKSVFFLNAMLLLSSTVMAVEVFEKEGELAATHFLSDLLRAYILLVAPIVAIVTATSPSLIALLLPQGYENGAQILPLVTLAAVCVGIMHRYSLVLSLHRRTGRLMWCTLGSLAVKILSSLLLTSHFGLIGAAASTLLGYGAWLIFVIMAARRFMTPRFPWVSLAKAVFCASIAMLATLGLAGPSVLQLGLAILVGFAIYAAGLVMTKEVSLTEIRSLKAIFRRPAATRPKH